MRRTVSLSEFMPYGAPELLAAGRPHLASALSAASAMAALLFVVALFLVPLIRAPLPPTPPPITIDPPPYVPQPPIAQPTPPRVPVGPPKSKNVVPVPVPTQDVPPIEPTTHAEQTGDQRIGDLTGWNTSEPDQPAPAVERLPVLGEFVPVDELPVSITEFKPRYPEIARAANVDGLVIVQALVGRDGRVLRVVVDPKFSILLLNEAALEGARRWVFKPAYANGHPVAVWVPIPYRFVLNE